MKIRIDIFKLLIIISLIGILNQSAIRQTPGTKIVEDSNIQQSNSEIHMFGNVETGINQIISNKTETITSTITEQCCEEDEGYTGECRISTEVNATRLNTTEYKTSLELVQGNREIPMPVQIPIVPLLFVILIVVRKR